MHPYREGHPLTFADAPADRDVAAVGLLVWTSSVARAALAFTTHEGASREVALAVLLVFALPVIARPSRAR